MKILSYIVVLLTTLLIGAILGSFLFPTEKKIYIEKIGKPKYIYIKPNVTDCGELKECYQSKINIAYNIEDNVLHIKASDACKATAQDVYLASKDDIKDKVIIGVVSFLAGSIATLAIALAL